MFTLSRKTMRCNLFFNAIDNKVKATTKVKLNKE